MPNVDIHVTDLTNTTTVTNGVADGTGVFDKLFNTVNLYIDDQYKDGRLKGPEYASVLLGSIEAVLAQSVQFVLQEQMVEAQIRTAYTDRVLKDKQAALLGLDEVVKVANVTPEAVYTPKYEV